MSFYENNKEWLEGWISDDSEEDILEFSCKDFFLTVIQEEISLIARKHKIVMFEGNYWDGFVRDFLGYRHIGLARMFANWKQPTDNEQDMFEMLYGVRLPWKEFIV